MSLEKDLKSFSDFSGLESSHCRISTVGPSILHVESKSAKKMNITLGFLALVHGNELLGLPVLNSLMKSILSGEIPLRFDVYFGLGNIPAAFADKRFITEDLNRAFGKTDDESQEAKRARELEVLMLDRCDFLIDLHQTVSPAAEPFFIFQYSSPCCLSIMKKWNPGIPTILQEDQIGENTGLSTDEYLRSRGKFGAALELGQLGSVDHFKLGLEICKNALLVTNEGMLEIRNDCNSLPFQVLKLSSSFKVKDSSFKLDEGWKNLRSFEKGERLGISDAGVIEAPEAGYMLFPRYRTVSAGQELFYYCTLDDRELETEGHLEAHENPRDVSII